MASLLERELVFVTGKGGAGKTTIAAALGLLAARRGRRTIVVEVGGQSRIPARLGAASADPGEEVRLGEGLWSTSIDPDAATIEWLRAVAGRAAARFLGSSSTFRYFAAAAPGAKELVAMVKLLDLLGRYDLVVLDAPATGHALGMLRSPQTFSAIARVGPLASRSDQVRALLADPARSGYVAVAHGSEMAVTEALELEESLRRLLDRDLDAAVVNGVLPHRFTREEMARLPAARDGVMATAVRAARAAYARTRIQESQIARLRRQRFADGRPARVLTIPFEITPELDAAAVARMAGRLGRSL
jgi:anion-transporting  ArsA/GET3 family ATPase